MNMFSNKYIVAYELRLLLLFELSGNKNDVLALTYSLKGETAGISNSPNSANKKNSSIDTTLLFLFVD